MANAVEMVLLVSLEAELVVLGLNFLKGPEDDHLPAVQLG